MRTTKEISLWLFDDAPEELQLLSPHGGEDWLMFVPTAFDLDNDGDGIPWQLPINESRFGCRVSRHKIESGTVFIGAHS